MTPLLLTRPVQAACSLLALSIGASPGFAQDTVGSGFALAATQPTPAAFASYDTLPSGDRVVFDGLTIDLYDGAGGFVMNLATLPSFVFNSFVEVDPASTFAIVGESTNGDLYRVALDGSGYTTIANLNFNFDAAFENGNSIIVSAALCGFGCGNDLVRVNTTTGTTSLLAHVSGPSGPVAIDDAGSLFYATVDIAMPNNTDIVYWTPAQLNAGTLLDERDATVFHAGLESASALAIDPVFGNVFLAESNFGATSRILEFDASNGNLVDVVVESASYLTNIELMQGATAGHFHAYQPEDGVFMHYNNGDIVTVRAQRPTASHSQAGSVATFTVQNAEPNAAMLVLFANKNLFNPSYFTVQLSFNFLFHSSVPPAQQRRTPLMIPTDSNGTGTFTYFDPGHLQGTLVFQALITNSSGGFIGSSTAALN